MTTHRTPDSADGLELAKRSFLAWASERKIPVATIEMIGDFTNPATRPLEVIIFFPEDADIKRHETSGTLDDIEIEFLRLLGQAGFEQVGICFDSHENVVENYEGSYFLRTRGS